MSYDTEHDFNWLLRAMEPRGQVAGDTPQELPHHVSDVINPAFDAFGWIRLQEYVFETATAVNANIISLGVVPSGEARLYSYVQVRAAGGAAAGVFWVALSNQTNPVAVSDAVALVDGQASSPPKRPILVPAGFLLQARSDQLSGVAVTMFIEAFFVTLNTGEYVPPT